jgi:predicted RNase H-like nuclease
VVVAGADGCPDGWVVCHKDISGALDIRIVKTLDEIFDLYEGLSILAIDIPIGFMDVQISGGRECEREARRLLGRKSSSVFSAPCRPALDAKSYDEVRKLPPPHEVGLSKQAYALFPKLNEVDHFMRQNAGSQSRIFEAHPDLAFASMNNDVPILASKKKLPGRTERLDLLVKNGLTPTIERLRGAARDDILDAVACCHTATLIASGEAKRLGSPDRRDRHGLPMNIWF